MRRRRDDEGSTAIETALTLQVTLMLLGGIFVFGLHMVYSGLAEHAARVGLRQATLQSSSGYATEAQVLAKVKALYPVQVMGDPTSLVLTAAAPAGDPTAGQGDTVTVTVTYHVPGLAKAVELLPDSGLRDAFASFANITRRATGRKE